MREDLSHVDSYFAKRGVATLGLRRTFHFVVRESASRARKGGVAGLEKLENADDASEVLTRDMAPSSERPGETETEASLMSELEAMMRSAASDAAGAAPESSLVANLSGEAQGAPSNPSDAQEDAVFRQSYLPRTLDEVYDPERDASIVRSGGVQSLIYAGVTGMADVDNSAAPQSKPETSEKAPQSVQVDTGDESDTEEDTESGSSSDEDMDEAKSRERDERKVSARSDAI